MFKPNYNSTYKEYANQSLDWIPGDSKKLYERNLKSNYNLLKNNNWIDNSFTYKFNSHGFRCEEFTSKPTVMFLGCSRTCGIGLPVDTIWPELVAKQLNMRCANLAQAGASCDTAFRLCHGWIDIIQPKLVVLLEPPGIRFEMTSDTAIRFLSPSWWRKDSEYYDFVRDWSMDENNNYFNSLKNQFAIANLCTSKNIKYVSIDPASMIKIDSARDLEHPGILSNKRCAEHAIEQIGLCGRI